MRRALLPLLGCLLLSAACDDDEPAGDGGEGGGGPKAVVALPGVRLQFFPQLDLTQPQNFFEFPFPSDLRRTADGLLDVAGWPLPDDVSLTENLKAVVAQRRDVPVVPVAWFRFSADPFVREPTDVIPAAPDAPFLLIDVDPASPDVGALLPTVASTFPVDGYTEPGLLGVAPRPGIVLHPNRTYAIAIQRSARDSSGEPLGSPLAFEQLKAGVTPELPQGEALVALYAPLWPALEQAGVERANVIGATVFTTGDVVQELFTLSEGLRARDAALLHDLAVDPDDGDHATYCELVATLTAPQYQEGTPPFDQQGLFAFGPDALPVKQRDEELPVRISIPKGQMPAGGWPLVLYFHGSGGKSTAIADRGTWRPVATPDLCPDRETDEWEGVQGCNTKGEGPGFVVARHGFAMAASALPVNPERIPGASDIEYINFSNIGMGRDLFRQGVIEQRMLLDALLAHTFTEGELAGCTGLSLPAGEGAHRFDPAKVYAQGQSMGGQYTNLVSAVEPRILGAVPTGAGGFWSYFILETQLIPDIPVLLPLLLEADSSLNWMHPALQLLEYAWEPIDPIVYAPRVARRPLPGHPARSIYEAAGQGDSYFPTSIYDAMALAYGHQQAGAQVWETMQPALALQGFDGMQSFPVATNATSEDGRAYTGVVVQYEGDGVYDPHAIYTQLDDVKHQYGCFLQTLRDDGIATVVAPAPLGTPCTP